MNITIGVSDEDLDEAFIRIELMDMALEIAAEWKAINSTQEVEWKPHGPVIVKERDTPDELKIKICSLMTTICEDFKPSIAVASDELRLLFGPGADKAVHEERGGMRNIDWQTCDDMTFGVYVIRYLTMVGDVPVCSTDPLMLKGWLAFKDTFGDVINDATRTEKESAEYHKGVANLKEWRDGGCK